MRRLAAGGSFVRLAEIAAQLDGRMSCEVEKMLDFTITKYFRKWASVSGLRMSSRYLARSTNQDAR